MKITARSVIASLVVSLAVAFSADAYTRINLRADLGANTVITNLSGLNAKALRVCPGATLTLYNTGTVTKPSTYATSSGTVKANPTTANSLGEGYFYVDDGTYDLLIDGCGMTRTIVSAYAVGTGASSTLEGPVNIASYATRGDGASAIQTGTGTLSVTNGSATVNGVGTLFTTELAVGDIIKVNNVDRLRVASISSPTLMALEQTYTGATGTYAYTYRMPWSGWMAAVPWVDYDTFYAPCGTYTTSAMDLSAYELFTLYGDGDCTKINISGAGAGITLGDSTPGDINNNRFGITLRNFWLDGNLAGTSTDGIAAYLTHHGVYSGIKITNFSNARLYQYGGVDNAYENLRLTGLETPDDDTVWSLYGLVLGTRGGAFEHCTASTVYNVYVSHSTSKGVWITSASSGITILGGASEGNTGGYGYYLDSGTQRVSMRGGHSESNTLGDYVHGILHRIENWHQQNALTVAADLSEFSGGVLGTVTITGNYNSFANLRYTGPGNFPTNPANTRVHNVRCGNGVEVVQDREFTAQAFTAGFYERDYAAKAGEGTTFTPSLGAQAGTFSCTTVVRARYFRLGKMLWVSVELTGCTVSVTPTYLTIAVPGGLVAPIAAQTIGTLAYLDNVTADEGVVRVSGNILYLSKDMELSAAWSAAAATSKFSFNGWLEVN